MAEIFKSKILQEQAQDEALLQQRYKNFKAYQAKANEIKTFKEEKFQTQFLRQIFEDCLGYTLDTTNGENFNLEQEKKNTTDGKKADGAIIVAKKVVGIIELKDQTTQNLDKSPSKTEPSPVDQAFGYRNSHECAKYVIVSNFNELRFYIDNKTAYEKFELFSADFEAFKRLHLLLSFENISADLPQKLKEKSADHESEISNKFYKDFSEFRLALFENICKNNPNTPKATLLSLTQKLCDRFVFILFAEDRGLLRLRTIAEIKAEFENQKFTSYSFYDIYKFYFNAIDKGSDKLQIPRYNGGLFATDAALNELNIDDSVLEAQFLSDYDFLSEISVNILGHIFENSLNDLEELNAQLSGGEFDAKKSKRKKDGIFYTPEFITDFIVQNTLGELCEAKKHELELDLSEPIIAKNPRKLSKTEEQIKDKIYAYREWLLSLKILDPACGSGAFLNQALEFLIAEHAKLDEFRRTFESEGFGFYDVAPEILERNLYGVDINADAVEIAKLSLWLRTAQVGRVLTDLSHNIITANSLLDFPFDFKFDVVIGNPPYFNIQTLGANSPIAQQIQKTYSEIWQDKSDILFYFFHKAMEVSKNYIGFITSNAFLFSDKAQRLRNFILKDTRLKKIINFERHKIFKDASITSCISIFSNSHERTKAIVLKNDNYTISDIQEYITNTNNDFEIDLKADTPFALVDERVARLNDKIDGNHKSIDEILFIGKGMETAANDIFLFDKIPPQMPKEYFKKHLSGENIKKFYIQPQYNYLLYFENIENFNDLPNSIQEYLNANYEILANRATVKNEGRIWWRYSRPMHKEHYHFDKIWCSYRNTTNEFALDNSGEYIGLTNTTVIFDTNENLKLKYTLALLNSKLFKFRFSSLAKQTGSGVFEYFANSVGKFRIPEISLSSQEPFIKAVDEISVLYADLAAAKERFYSSLELEKLGKKLEKFDELEFDEFCKEFAKAKGMKFKDKLDERNFKDEWRTLFEADKVAVCELKAQILKLENQIDEMVFALYGLNDAEIALVRERERERE